MKKLLILTLAICFFQLNANAQRVVHAHYITYYNPSKKEPDSVSWNLSSSMVICEREIRKDMFLPDPSIPGCATKSDYTNSGYSKGHLFNWDEAKCDGGSVGECFYMSNMLPQNQPFNAGDWGTVERYERKLAQSQNLHIIAGGSGSLGKTMGGVNIPDHFWKAIYANGKWTCWSMPNNSSSVGHDYTHWQIPIGQFDTLTGLKL
jgi:DNA/RNA endonuclease G (NUC1)